MTPKPNPPHEVRLRMALEAARAREGEDRVIFLSWLRTADPDLAREVEAVLGGETPPCDAAP